MKKLITVVAVTVFMFFLLVGYSTNVNSNLSSNMVRLHVIANSDSDEDQSLKLKVRDAILSHSKKSFTKKDEVAGELESYRKIAKEVILQNGYDYEVEVEYGNFKFPTKEYNNLRLPAGNYDAVRIKIGNAEGQNWWCVMFPPLCFVDGTTDTTLAEEKLYSSLGEENSMLITKADDAMLPFEIKFKIVEIYGKLCGRDKVFARAD